MGFTRENLDPTFLEEKIQEIKMLSFHRQMIEQCELGAAQFKEKKTLSYEEGLDWVNHLSDMISESKKDITYRTVSEILKNYDEERGLSFLECLEKRQEQAKKGLTTEIGLPTHYKEIDAIFDGFKPGHLIVIGARPGVGKTTFMCNLVL